MRRREFIALLGGAAAAWPLAAGGQQIDRVRRVGFLTPVAESDPEAQNWINALTHHLEELGWMNGNIRIDYRFGNADVSFLEKTANELVELHPDVILAGGAPAAAALRQWTLSIPIVFVQVAGCRSGSGWKLKAA
jgi:putative tryptophan/tyrosine transport system substrate-binding protein